MFDSHTTHVTSLSSGKSIWITNSLIIFSNVFALRKRVINRWRQKKILIRLLTCLWWADATCVAHVILVKTLTKTCTHSEHWSQSTPKTSSLQSNNRTIHLETTPYDPIQEIERILQSLGLHRVVSSRPRQLYNKFILSFFSLHHSLRHCLSLPTKQYFIYSSQHSSHICSL